MMPLSDAQKTVDDWIQKFGVRYFDELTNLALLTEEVGELARLISRAYGEQSFKTQLEKGDIRNKLGEELSDILFVVLCLANQMDIDMTEAFQSNMAKKTQRDKDRHHDNPKLRRR